MKSMKTKVFRLLPLLYILLGGLVIALSIVFVFIFANLRSIDKRVDTVLALLIAGERRQIDPYSPEIGKIDWKDIDIAPITGGIDGLAWQDINDYIPSKGTDLAENDITPWLIGTSQFLADPREDTGIPIYANHNVYITFDDGPDIYTDEILDILAEYGVKATFFTNGKEGDEMLSVYRRIVDEGHTLGMHSFTHKYADIYRSKESFAADFEKLQYFLYGITGVKSSIYRFPGGSSGLPVASKLPEYIDYLHSKDVEYFDWNISAMDATQNYISAETIVNNCLRNIVSFEDAVILLHDRADKRTTVEALPILLDKLTKMENITILPITQDTKPIQHRW